MQLYLPRIFGGILLCRRVGLQWVLLCLACLVVTALAAVDFDPMRKVFVQRWGDSAVGKFSAWSELISSGGTGDDMDKLKRVNEFFNRNIRFGDEQTIWGQSDYWATPLETLGRGAGDCEDFVIAKYFSLKLLGVAPSKLRLIYVYLRTGSSPDASPQAHMVLAYYPTPDAVPMVLDNLISDVRPANRRPDLSPVFSFNGQGIFSGTSGTVLAPAVGTGRLSRWEDLLKRASAEGFD
jgi:predicted transglutaminase-like cysteine proteinase